MGALKLSYYQQEQGLLEKNPFFLDKGLEKNAPEQKKRLSAYRYGFNGMEKDDEVTNQAGTSYDFGARLYNPRVGRWLSLDPRSKDYPSLSDYVFAGNTPIMAYDPNGEYIIFINGLNTAETAAGVVVPVPGAGIGMSGVASEVVDQAYSTFGPTTIPDQATSYWQGFDKAASEAWNDNKLRYIDGGPGTWLHSASDEYRENSGRQHGTDDASVILSNLKPGETIKVVTHSMGAVFGRGYVEGLQTEMKSIVDNHNKIVTNLMDLAEQAGIDYTGPMYMSLPEIEIVVDIAPYSNDGKGQSAVNNVPTYQMSGDKDNLSGDGIWPGAKAIPVKSGTGHSIGDFNSSDLPNVSSSGSSNIKAKAKTSGS